MAAFASQQALAAKVNVAGAKLNMKKTSARKAVKAFSARAQAVAAPAVRLISARLSLRFRQGSWSRGLRGLRGGGDSGEQGSSPLGSPPSKEKPAWEKLELSEKWGLWMSWTEPPSEPQSTSGAGPRRRRSALGGPLTRRAWPLWRLCANQIFNPTSICAYSNVLTRSLPPCFENSLRAIDSSKNQPNRLRFDRAREFSSLVRTTQTSG